MTSPSPLEAIFFAALAKHAPAERTAYLKEACAGNDELRATVERMLAAQAAVGNFLEQPAMPGNATSLYEAPISERAGSVIGPYKLLQQIGEGGMGVVFMAEQSEPIQRTVALKIIKPGMDTRQVIARFEAERQALALMDHPNIAKVLDAGTTAPAGSGYPGRPYFVMELVKGVPITDFCDARKLTPKQRLELFIPVCQAIQHAHQKGIIHRDIKPSNVMISLYDDCPVPKVIDFGVAKAAGQALTEKTLNTGFSVVGTPQYMSPEQATLNQLDIDTRSDIYSLGVLLYELLAGSPPFEKQAIESAGYLEMLRVIREDEPPRPSTKLSTAEGLPSLSANRGTEPAKLMGLLRNELDWIVMKALEKDRSRRYETANGFAADIGRYLAGEPVLAHPPSKSYRIQKFLRKNRGPAIATGFVALALVGGMIGTTWGLIRAEASRRDAEAARIAESERAEGERLAKQEALDEKTKAQEAEAATLAAYRASADEAIEELIGSKPELGQQEKRYLENTLERWKKFADRKGDDEGSRAIRAEGHYRVARLWQRLGRNTEAQTESRQALAIRKKLAADFPNVPEYRKDLAENHNNLGILLKELGKRTEAEEQYRNAVAIQEKLIAEYPAEPAYRYDLAQSRANLGILLNGLGKRALAEEEYRKALEINERLAAEFPAAPEYRRELSAGHDNLGLLMEDLGKPAEAEEQHRKALVIDEKLAADFPDVPAYRNRLANTHNNLGNLLNDVGQNTEAEEQYRKSLAIKEQQAAEFPAVPEYREELAASLTNLGHLMLQLGKATEAEDYNRKALAIKERLVAEFPTVPAYRDSLANCHFSLGGIMKSLGQQPAAVQEYRKAIEIEEKLVAEFPSVPNYRKDLADSYNNLGNLLEKQGKRVEAEEQYRKALSILENLFTEFPGVPEYEISLAGSYCNFGILVRDGGQPRESLEWFDKAIHTLTADDKAVRHLEEAKTFLRNSYWNRSQAYGQLQKYAEAIRDWDRVIDLSPQEQQPSMHVTRALLRHRAGQIADAVSEVADLTARDSSGAGSSQWSGEQYYNFACIYAVASAKVADKQQEYADRAMTLLQRAVKAGWTDAAHIAADTDLDALRDREDFKMLVSELESKSPANPSEKK